MVTIHFLTICIILRTIAEFHFILAIPGSMILSMIHGIILTGAIGGLMITGAWEVGVMADTGEDIMDFPVRIMDLTIHTGDITIQMEIMLQ